MVYAREAKAAGSNPRALAGRSPKTSERQPDVEAEVAGPGFINIALKTEVYAAGAGPS